MNDSMENIDMSVEWQFPVMMEESYYDDIDPSYIEVLDIYNMKSDIEDSLILMERNNQIREYFRISEKADLVGDKHYNKLHINSVYAVKDSELCSLCNVDEVNEFMKSLDMYNMNMTGVVVNESFSLDEFRKDIYRSYVRTDTEEG
jgi:hypothetical protein